MRNDIKRNLCASTRYANYVAQIMPLFTANFGMTFAKNGHIERLKFTGTEMNQHSSET